jgi:hypothetical protein
MIYDTSSFIAVSPFYFYEIGFYDLLSSFYGWLHLVLWAGPISLLRNERLELDITLLRVMTKSSLLFLIE